MARYVGRYVRHPAIANRRITYFDGSIAKFYYDDEGEIVNVVMTADEFITALIQHIPEPHFKMVRYYGAYARRSKGRFGARIQSGIKQLTMYQFGLIKPILCPLCGGEVEFVWYCKKFIHDRCKGILRMPVNIPSYYRTKILCKFQSKFIQYDIVAYLRFLRA